MRNLLLLSFLALIFLTSCTEGEQEIWINADGSAVVEKKFAGLGSFLSMVPQEELFKLDSSANWMDTLFSTGKFDTIVSIEDMAREEMVKSDEPYSRMLLREEFLSAPNLKVDNPEEAWELVEKLLDAKIRMKLDYEEGIFDITTIFPFADINQAHEAGFDRIKEIMGEQELGNEMMDLEMLDLNSEFIYELSKNKLVVKRAPIAHSSEGGDEEQDEMEAFFAMMSGGAQGKTLKIHVPGKIKSVDRENATYNNTIVVYEISADDLNDPNAQIDLTILFKKKKKFKLNIPTF